MTVDPLLLRQLGMDTRPAFQTCPQCELRGSCAAIRRCAKHPHPGQRIDPIRKDEYDTGLDAVDDETEDTP